MAKFKSAIHSYTGLIEERENEIQGKVVQIGWSRTEMEKKTKAKDKKIKIYQGLNCRKFEFKRAIKSLSENS